MKGYIHYVHNVHTNPAWLAWYRSRKNKSEADYKAELQSYSELGKTILSESNQEVLDYVSEHLDLARSYQNILFSTSHKSYIDNVDFNRIRAIINFRPLNDIEEMNEHFSSVNRLLPDAGIYIGRVETYWERYTKIIGKFGKRLGRVVWLTDFLINRVCSKLRPINYVYKLFSKSKIRRRSRAEILGRLVFMGFEIVDYKVIDNMMYFVVIKTNEPMRNHEPSFHALVRLNRVGKGGKIIKVFKFRTMHPYSEFLQDFVIKLNGYNEFGKPARDFRVTRWGKLFRKLWIDEIPQIINVLRGEMKIVGVRPLSRVRYNEFPEDLQKERIKHKPGCIPPYVALNMPDAVGNIIAERIYLHEKALRPIYTDIKYFFMAVFNVVTNRIRSA